MTLEDKQYLRELSKDPHWTMTVSTGDSSCPMQIMYDSAELKDYMKTLAQPGNYNTEVMR